MNHTPTSCPGETIQDLADEHAFTWVELASLLDISISRLSGVLCGIVPIDEVLASALERTFGTPADFWLAREKLYRDSIRE